MSHTQRKNTMFAVIKTGGKQYLVEEGKHIKIEKLELEEGSTVDFEALLLVDGDDIKVGTPVVSGAKVTATVMEQGRLAKVEVRKMKPKVRYRRNVGHRQPFTRIKIEKISA